MLERNFAPVIAKTCRIYIWYCVENSHIIVNCHLDQNKTIDLLQNEDVRGKRTVETAIFATHVSENSILFVIYAYLRQFSSFLMDIEEKKTFSVYFYFCLSVRDVEAVHFSKKKKGWFEREVEIFSGFCQVGSYLLGILYLFSFVTNEHRNSIYLSLASSHSTRFHLRQ